MDNSTNPTLRAYETLILAKVQRTLAAVLTIPLGLLGAAMVLQSDRWSRTPAYGLLLQIWSAKAWGVVYLVVAAAMVASLVLRTHRLVAYGAHLMALALLGFWDTAFLVRWLTDPLKSTTPVNVIHWGLVLFLAGWSILLIPRKAKT